MEISTIDKNRESSRMNPYGTVIQLQKLSLFRQSCFIYSPFIYSFLSLFFTHAFIIFAEIIKSKSQALYYFIYK